MSVSSELLCSFELLKPLDSTALKNHIKKGRNKRNSLLSSPVSISIPLRAFSPRAKRSHLRCNDAEGRLILQVFSADTDLSLSLHYHPLKVSKAAHCI